ncbi:hypothetical protein, partial [Roseibacillus persicicus]
ALAGRKVDGRREHDRTIESALSRSDWVCLNVRSKIMKTVWLIVRVILYTVVTVVVLDGLGLLGLTYASFTENQPLNNPQTVVEVGDDSLLLEDGTIVSLDDNTLFITVMTDGRNLPEFFEDRPKQVEIREVGKGEDLRTEVVVSNRRFYCGTPYVRAVTIPIFPRRYERYEEKVLAVGEAKQLLKRQ